MTKDGNISFFRKFLICTLTGLVCSMTVLRIVTRLAFERGVNPATTPAPAIAVIPAGIIFLCGLFYSFFWQQGSGKEGSEQQESRCMNFLRFILCYGIALDLAMIGLQKWFGLQAHTPIALLDGPFSGFSGEDLSWAYFGRSPAFLNVIGGIQILGSILLVFPRTRLLGVFTLLPVMLNICLMNYFYHFYPGELGHAVILMLGLLYLLVEEYGRLVSFFFGHPSTETTPIAKTMSIVETRFVFLLPANALRYSVVVIPLLLIICFFHLPHRDREIYGKYQVTYMWINDKTIDPGNCKDSVLTQVYIDENNDCVFAYNNLQRLVLGNYRYDRATRHLRVTWRYPPGAHDTLDAMMNPIPGGLNVGGRMGKSLVKMDWKKVW